MKILPFIFLSILIAVFCLTMPSKPKAEQTNYDYLRIHIKANSNSNADQQLKFEIKNNIVNFLTPYLAEAKTKQDAINILKSNLNIIQGLVDNKLNEKGFNYSSSCDIDNKHFPSRYYDNYLLEEGEYDALIVTLGEGKGDNWWCVVYPPLCFVNKNCEQEQDIVYNSRLMEVIKKFFN